MHMHTHTHAHACIHTWHQPFCCLVEDVVLFSVNKKDEWWHINVSFPLVEGVTNIWFVYAWHHHVLIKFFLTNLGSPHTKMTYQVSFASWAECFWGSQASLMHRLTSTTHVLVTSVWGCAYVYLDINCIVCASVCIYTKVLYSWKSLYQLWNVCTSWVQLSATSALLD